jgi:hypothetical protein
LFKNDSGQAGMTDKNALCGFTNDRISNSEKFINNLGYIYFSIEKAGCDKMKK